MTLSQLLKKEDSIIKKLDTLEVRKDKCVDDQNKMQDEFLSDELTDNRKYEKLIDLDFDLAEKIRELLVELKSIQRKIKYQERKQIKKIAENAGNTIKDIVS